MKVFINVISVITIMIMRMDFVQDMDWNARTVNKALKGTKS